MYQPSVLIITVLLILLYELGYFFVMRQWMVSTFVSQDIRQDSSHHASLKKMYVLGMRFDVKILTISLGGLLILVLIASYFLSHMATGVAIAIGFVCLILNGIVIGNIYYFKTYQNHYDIFMFGLVDDDTKAVLKNILDDYPILRLILIVSLSAIIPAVFAYYAVDQQWFTLSSTVAQIVLTVVTILLLALGMRGTIHSKPLGKGHSQVCQLGIINKMVPNGVTAMQWAFTDNKEQISFSPVSLEEGSRLLEKLGYEDGFYQQTPVNNALAQISPHVVVAIMESFGANVLVFDDPLKNDLLGRLRPMLDKSFYFSRFCADYNGTAPTLANIFFHSPIQNISQSVAQKVALPETPFKVYKNKGYKTIFITAGNMMWRGLANYMPLQGVDEMYDQNDIIEHFPDAKASMSYWGIADEFAFALAEKLLRQSTQPLFISILSMSNHPPHEIPPNYVPKPLDVDCLLNRFGKNEQERKSALTTYQYANDSLGHFMQAIYDDEMLGSKTIMAATGDHHFRGVRVETPSELFLSKAVPFIVYIPEKLQAILPIAFDSEIVGSHKDILPTLYHVSLSDARYWHACGRNLLAEHKNTSLAFAYNDSCWADEKGVVDFSTTPLTQYQWRGDGLFVSDMIPLTPAEKTKIKAFQDFLYWQINYLVGKGEAQ